MFVSLYDGKSTGDTMHSYIRDLTVSVGEGNPGAAGLRFMTNNTGAVVDVTVRSEDPDGAGAIGLDLRQSQLGPGLVQRVTVEGFDIGVKMGNTFSMVFEDLTLTGQREIALDNNVGRLSIHRLRTTGAPLAIRNGKHGHLTLIDAALLEGTGNQPAITYQSPKVFLRDVRQEGYTALIQDTKGAAGTLNEHGEFYPLPSYTLFDTAPKATLRLPVVETPVIPWQTDLDKWIGIGGRANEGKKAADITQELQAAIDQAAKTGATTIYFRKGNYRISKPIRVHGSVNRIIGMQTVLNFAENDALAADGEGAVFVLDGVTSEAIVFERFFLFGGWDRPSVCVFDNRDGIDVVIRHLGWTGARIKRNSGAGRWFVEDVAGSRRGPWTIGKGEQLWARQLNPESANHPLIVVEDGGTAWVMGFKTEGRTSHVVARNGAKVEILGGVSYQSWGGQKLDPPMFDITDSELSATLGFYHYADRGFTTIVQETQGGKTKSLLRKELKGYHLPVYRTGE